MFSGRQDLLEASFMKHIDKEEKAFEHLIATLDSIKSEISKTNEQMAALNASNKLQILEAKSEILTVVFEKLVARERYEEDRVELATLIKKLDSSIDDKVDKSSVKLIWAVLLSISSLFAWFIKGG